MKKFFSLIFALALVSSALFAGGGGETSDPAAAAKIEVKKISLIHGLSAESPWQKACLAWKNQVDEQSKGHYAVQVYPNNRAVWKLQFPNSFHPKCGAFCGLVR
jgi:TRAP-type C4-dicarboxylate transport system substrate-binding protein